MTQYVCQYVILYCRQRDANALANAHGKCAPTTLHFTSIVRVGLTDRGGTVAISA